jgi:hypothetical protein
MTKARQIAISLFICLNLGTVVYMNRPKGISHSIDTELKENLSPLALWRVGLMGWAIHHYAHFVGLDNRWEMFSFMPHFNWWFVFKAHYKDSSEEILPLAFQMERTWIEKYFFDFREAKFHLNIYNNRKGQKAYADYLCRFYSAQKAIPIESIVLELHYQNLLDREIALQLGHHKDGEPYSQIWNRTPCPNS